ncbi:MAG: isocitrate/isopropylmalate family dehydrogenase [Candidatus Bipolaricaulia bacterium]
MEQPYRVAVIPGDGIGPEVIEATVAVLNATGVRFSFQHYEAGDRCLEQHGVALPEETLQGALDAADAVLFGAAGETAAEVIIRLRRELETFVNLRPTWAFPGVPCLKPETDLIIVRENTECLYRGIEEEIAPGVTVATRVITEEASIRIARYAFEYATDHDRHKVTAVHKANVLKVTDGLFRASVRRVAEEYTVPFEEMLVDAAALHLVNNPGQFDVIVTTNMFGDILSDLSAGLIGGLGLCPSANIGLNHGLFEPVHGTAPDIAGRGIANPTAAILSAAMMLRYLREDEAAEQVDSALRQALESRKTTPDLGGTLSTMEMANAVVDFV